MEFTSPKNKNFHIIRGKHSLLRISQLLKKQDDLILKSVE